MGALLALASAALYGLADFAGGLLSRRAHFAAVALLGQLGGLVLAAVLILGLPGLPGLPGHGPVWSDLGWGALSGVGTGLAMLFLYRGIGRGAMTVVVPVSAVGGVAFPVLIGVSLLGDRPSALAWTGIAVAVPALWLVSHTGHRTGAALTPAAVDALLAGIGIAIQYLALARAGPDSGLWPVLAGRVAAVLILLPMAAGVSLRLPARRILAAAATGGAAALALSCYLLATRHQLVVIAVVLSSLYPVLPVLLGVTMLRERLGWQQITGLVGATAAIGLLTVG